MIPNNVDVVNVQSNIDSAATGQFTVDENSLAKIMGVLTNLYTDPEGAVVREYLTNALDAQIEAQVNDPAYVWRPIEVTLPGPFSKSYSVRDFGIGMSVDDIKNIYSKYGKSTKETSNDVTGMLGLGSKCALTYTNQFTITGIKNGVKTKAIVTKNEADIPTFMIVDTRATDEANGVEISVPVRDRNTFEDKTRKFLRFWHDGQVLVNGKEPDKHTYKEIKPDVFLVERDQYDRYGAVQSYVVMGNVPYGVENEYVAEGLRNAGLGYVVYVPMGSIDFPPSREKLMMTTRTKKKVEEISNGLFDIIMKEALEAVENAGSFKEAFVAYKALPHYFRNSPNYNALQYKGHDFPNEFKVDHMTLGWDYNGNGQISERSRFSTEHHVVGGTLIVTGVKQDAKPTSYFKKKVREWINQENLGNLNAVLVKDDLDNIWLQDCPRVDFETIRSLKLPRNGPVGPRVETPYDFWYIDKSGDMQRGSAIDMDLPKGYTMAYVSPTNLRETYRKPGTTEVTLATMLGDSVFLVVLAKNRFDKFKRAYPKAVPCSKVYQDRINWLVDNTKDDEFLVKSLNDNVRQFISAIQESDVTDPDLKSLIKVVASSKNGKTNYEVAVELHQHARRADFVCSLPSKKAAKVNPVDIVKRYPLLDTYHNIRNNAHLTYYVNAVFDAEHAPKP